MTKATQTLPEKIHGSIRSSHGFIRATLYPGDGIATQLASSGCPVNGYAICCRAIKQWAADNGYDCDINGGSALLTKAS